MTLFERYPVIARPLYGLLAALLGAAAILTIVNYAGSPTDENLFADMPRPMSLYVMKPIPAQGDTIRAGDLIVKINGITLSDSSALVTILKAAAGDSILKVTTYRPSALSGSASVACGATSGMQA